APGGECPAAEFSAEYSASASLRSSHSPRRSAKVCFESATSATASSASIRTSPALLKRVRETPCVIPCLIPWPGALQAKKREKGRRLHQSGRLRRSAGCIQASPGFTRYQAA